MDTQMRRRVRPARLRRVRQARAAMMLFIILVGLPMLFFGGAIAVDYTRIVIAQRQASQLADAASLAGTMQVVPNDPDDPNTNSSDLLTENLTLEEGRGTYLSAENQALEFLNRLDGPNTADAANRLTIESVTAKVVQQASAGDGPSTLEVTIEWRIDGLVFLGFLSEWFGNGDNIRGGTTTRSSFVCEPADDGADTTNSPTYLGRCARPNSAS